jgi:Universal stress protein family
LPDGVIVVATDGSAAAVKAVEVGLGLAVAQASDVVFVHFSPAAGPLFDANPWRVRHRRRSKQPIRCLEPRPRRLGRGGSKPGLRSWMSTALVISLPRSLALLRAWAQA